MDPKQLFNIWAPPNSIWSCWAKPVLFLSRTISKGSDNIDEGSTDLPDLFNFRTEQGTSALIINLPGVDSVKFGLALAISGFQPVPLFNASDGIEALIDLKPIIHALKSGAEILQRTPLRPDAPPAFLIDSNRLQGHPSPGQFDNRWVVFPQDFPSAVFFQSHGIKRMIVVKKSNGLGSDLGQVLSLWKRAGLEIFSTNIDTAEPRTTVELKPVRRFDLARMAFATTLVASLGLSRNMAGGFGSHIPMPNSGG